MSGKRWCVRVFGLGVNPDTIASYLPARWDVVGFWPEGLGDGRAFVEVVGEDHAGWTFRDYVEPRLASGLYFCEVVS